MSCNYIRVIAAFVVGLAFALCCVAQTAHETIPKQADPLKTSLRKYLGEPEAAFEQDGPTRYSSVFADLKGDGSKQTIVYITGRGWCGSGGCVMLILDSDGASYKLVTQTTVTRLPVRILSSKSNSWHDLSVVVAGGGIQPGYEALLSFDGKTYPTNPTVPPARPLKDKVEGRTVLSSATKDEPLYQ